MKISTNFFIKKEEQKDLANILGCKVTELPVKLRPFANAAIKEITSMFLGQKVFNKGSDMIEYRLFLLIQYACNGRIPDELEVCRLFQNTATTSRSLIRAVMSKYQYELKSAIENTLVALLEDVKLSDDGHSYIVSVHNLNLVEALNNELAEIDTNLPPVQKKRGSVSTFEIKPSSYIRLCGRFKVKPINEEEDEISE